MTPEIKDIFEDICRLEPSLREHEEDVVALIEELLAGRPAIEMSEEFRSSLREKVLEEFGAMAAAPEKQAAVLPAFLSKMAYVLGGAAIALVLIFPFVVSRQGQPAAGLPTDSQTGLGGGQELGLGGGQASGADFVDVGGHAFGALGLSSGWNETTAPTAEPTEDLAAGMGLRQEAESGRGGSGVSGSPAAAPAVSPKLATDGLVPYQPTGFEFKYAGDPLKLTDGNVEVLKRSKRVDVAGVSSIVSVLDLGLFDARSLSDVQINNIGLSEDHDFGYDLQISLNEGTAYLNQNYSRWQIGPGCENGVCNDLPSLTPADMPGNEEIFALVDSFIAEMGISREGYGAPQLDDSWRRMPPPAPDQPIYVPDYVQVKYPLIIKDRPVYGGPGYQAGLDVTVDIRHKKVSNLGPIQSHRYETSSYPAETDAARIISVAEQGGFGGGWYFPEAEKKVTLELETPQLVYLQQYAYNGVESSELYVPALLFPIKDWQEKGFWSSSVAVPLAKEMLDQQDQNFPGPRPMPLIEPAPAERVK